MKFNRRYMKGKEFKIRQAWLPFTDAVGIVLQLLEPMKEKAWRWFANWKNSLKNKNRDKFETIEQYKLNLFIHDF